MTDYSFSQNYWSEINSPTSKTLTNCFFINSGTGWLSGDSGTIIRTTNGGNNWTVQNSGIVNNIEDIFFLNERLGWATAFEVFPDSNEFPGTHILKTTNGGEVWTNSMFPDTNMFMTSVYYLDSLKGFLGGIAAAIVMTTNNGLSWTYTDTDSSLFFTLPVFDISFYDDQIGYACGGFRDIAGITWVTTNGGFNWRGTVLAPEPFFDIAILNSQKTICSGGDLEYGSSIASTSNQGANWFYDTLGVFGLATGIDNRTQSEIWMTSGYAAKFLYSLDTGNTWAAIPTPGNPAILDLDFTDSLYGFACGVNGVILKYDKTKSSVLNDPNEIHDFGFALYQNYPNPFNPKTIINYTILSNVKGQMSNVKLIVYNSSGSEISTLVNGKQKPGSYTVEFNAGNLPSGIYFYKLSSSGFSVTKKMIVLK
ncbi:MAG: T9SS type A sorting domain-containing protein [Ignavibacteria bacterium]|nr:T9SS type A sorting domain-containing protein [Ignavibacteria bacterium]